MKWKIVHDHGSYLVCRKTWHSSEWMGLEKKDIRMITLRDRTYAVEVYAECSTIELANKLLALKSRKGIIERV